LPFLSWACDPVRPFLMRLFLLCIFFIRRHSSREENNIK
jgi:hypothetical protein